VGGGPPEDGRGDRELSAPLARLVDWEDAGAGWHVAEHTGDRAVVMLLTCTGEPVDRLETDDPEALAYLRGRWSSEP
jgi:hypothetical protein